MGTRLTAKSAILGNATAATDVLYIVDVSLGTSHKITRDELHAAIVSGFFASQAQAEAGTDNTRVMTPLRTAQAIAALASPGWVLVESQDISGTPTNVDFTNFDATAYDAYKFEFMNIKPSADAGLRMRTNSDGTATWDTGATDYRYVNMAAEGDGTPGYSGSDDGGSGAAFMQLTPSVGTGVGEDGISGTLSMNGPDLLFHTIVAWNLGGISTDNDHIQISGSGRRLEQAAVEGARFYWSSGNFEDQGRINMYGLTNA